MTEKELRKSVVEKAERYIGTVQGDYRHREIVDTYNKHTPLARGYRLKYTDAWCAGAISAWFIMAGLQDLSGTEVGTGKFITIFQTKGIWVENDAFVPQTGDIIVYNWDDDGKGDCKTGSSHVGLVQKVQNGKIFVLEGNMGSKSVVGIREIAINARYIRGFATPKYSTKATEEEPKKEETVKVEFRVLKKGTSGSDVRYAMLILQDKGYYKAYIPKTDKTFGANMDKAVRDIQKAYGLVVDGIVGAKTWPVIFK